MLKQCIKKLITFENLSSEETYQAVLEMINDPNPVRSSAFLVLLRAKGETEDELLGICRAMQESMIPFPVNFPILDIVGTGGDGFHTVNISTASSILAASCGVKVAKLGNRSSSSLCGSADLLEAIGISLDLPIELCHKSLEEAGMTFLFAPVFHPALKNMAAIRKDLNIRTTFNLISPILNPAKPAYQMIGVFDDKLLQKLAGLLFKMETKHSLVFHGCGLDELSCLGPSNVIEVSEKGLNPFQLDPKKYGLPSCQIEDLKGGNAEENSKIILHVFEGEKGPVADTLALNCGTALWLYGKTPDIGEGIAMAKEHLEKGAAIQFLDNWRNLLNQWRKLCIAI